jgi:hypothetical protein
VRARWATAAEGDGESDTGEGEGEGEGEGDDEDEGEGEAGEGEAGEGEASQTKQYVTRQGAAPVPIDDQRQRPAADSAANIGATTVHANKKRLLMRRQRHCFASCQAVRLPGNSAQRFERGTPDCLR